MTGPDQPILLVAITARMLAELAVRAGYDVLALDYFGDADLQLTCPSRSLMRDFAKSYSAAALVDAAGQLDAPAVVYGASLENHPAEVARLARGRRLLGNSPEILARVRNPLELAAALQVGGFLFPRTVAAGPAPPADPGRAWLWKPLRSGGGHGVRLWRGGPAPEEGVWQERVPGLVCSAAFVADGREAVLLGLTEQLVGQPVLGATRFRYCGNLLPPRLPAAELAWLATALRAAAGHLTRIFGLRGINGLDFIWHEGRAWIIEVNPRLSASLELMDRAYELPVFAAHAEAFSGRLPDFALEAVLARRPATGKAIVYASRPVIVPDTRGWLDRGWRDIPHPGERIERQHPICTILVTAATPAACWQELKRQAARLNAELAPAS